MKKTFYFLGLSIGLLLFHLKIFGQCTPVLTANLPDPLCSGTNVTLYATINLPEGCALASGTPFTWYKNGTYGSSTSANTITVNDAGVYTVQVQLANTGGCPCNASTISSNAITINATPNSPAAQDPIIVCLGQTTSILAFSSGTGNNSTFSWYNGNQSTANLLFVGNPYTTPAITSSPTDFYVTETVNGCESERTKVSVSGTSLNIPSYTVQNTSVCSGGSATLVASGSNGSTFEWSENFNFNPILATGSQYSTYPLNNATHTFYLRQRLGNCTSNHTTITVNTSVLTTPIGNGVTICEGQTANLTATVNGGTSGNIVWFSDLLCTNSVHTGSSFTTQPLTTTTTYYLKNIDGNCESGQSSVTVTVNLNPDMPEATNQTICYGATANLSATGNGTLYWYDTPNGGTSIGMGSSFTTPNLYQTTFYYVESQNASGCRSQRKQVQVTANQPIQQPTVVSIENVCNNTTANLTATGNVIGNVLRFYEGNQILCTHTIASFDLTGTCPRPNQSVNSNYYVTEYNPATSCESSRSSISVIVQPFIPLPFANNPTECEGNEVIGEATYGSSNTTFGNFYWYSVPTGGTALFIGQSYNIPSNLLNVGINTFYVEEQYNNCASARREVIVTVNENPVLELSSITNNTPICEGSTLELINSNNNFATNILTPSGAIVQSNQIIITEAIQALHQGDYAFTITNTSTGCFSEPLTVFATIYENPETPSLTSNSPVCENSTLTNEATNLPVDNYIWTLPDGTQITNTSNVYSILGVSLNQEGEYKVQTKKNICYSGEKSIFNIVNPTPQPTTLSSNSPICENSNLQLFSSPAQNAEYVWEKIDASGNFVLFSTEQNPIIYNASLLDGTFYRCKIFLNDCPSNYSNISTIVNPLPTPINVTNTSITNTICEGATVVLHTDLQPNFSYEWNGPNGFNLPGNSVTINNVNQNLHQGVYYVTLTTAEGCSTTATTLVAIQSTPQTPNLQNNSPVCAGEEVEFVSSEIPNNYILRVDNIGDQTNEIFTKTILTSDYYSAVLISDKGCISPPTTTYVKVNPLPDLTNIIDNYYCNEGDVIQLFSEGGVYYQWTLNGWYALDYLDGVDFQNPFFSSNQNGIFNFELEVTNQDLCSNQKTVIVNVKNSITLEFYDIFTPNGDGINDTWVIEYIENFPEYTVLIFSSNNVLVYEQNATDYAITPWDGTFKNTATKVPSGTYIYCIKHEGHCKMTGLVTLIVESK